ncbi:hypothetical protein H5410_025995 [Solanum commersonii]|uniref:Uncharacterized protein n=1 Tax=Solanum commersonii TaxID=4109 RepID=A0A9J5YXN1_SOLCO|nr:hypothetical protein H5410_025995 [Solanum commersonii]
MTISSQKLIMDQVVLVSNDYSDQSRSVLVTDMLDVSLNLQSLRICDLKISVKRISCALCLLRNSPNLVELDIDEVVKVRHTLTLVLRLQHIDMWIRWNVMGLNLVPLALLNFLFIKLGSLHVKS